jgi:hypothetical protein
MDGPSAENLKGFSEMMKRVASLAMLAGAVALTCVANAATPMWHGQPVKPMFKVLPAKSSTIPGQRAGTLQTWTGTYTDLKGHTITFKHVGVDPSTSNTTTHIKMIPIPVIFVYGPSNGNLTLDPSAKSTGGKKKKSVMQMFPTSPLIDDGAKFKSGRIKLGSGQYVDEFQRANWWGSVKTNSNYHTVLDYTTGTGLPPLTITVAQADGSVVNNPFGSGVVGTDDINVFDEALGNYLAAHADVITPDVFPLFISYDIYLTEGTCCIGGYHSANGAQSYGYSTYEDSTGSFSEDVDALSHEIAEWYDDPFTNNHVFCQDNSIMEVGDPLEGLDNYGTFTVKLNGFTWHPQSLAMMPYFGAPVTDSANGWTALHNDITNVCPGQ